MHCDTMTTKLRRAKRLNYSIKLKEYVLRNYKLFPNGEPHCDCQVMQRKLSAGFVCYNEQVHCVRAVDNSRS